MRERKLSADSSGTYLEHFSEEDEVLFAECLFDGNKESEEVFLKYISHYPLCNKAVDVLIKRLPDAKARKILLNDFSRYGFNENQGLAICKLAPSLDEEFMIEFSKSGRIFFSEVYHRLSLLDMKNYQAKDKRKDLPTKNLGEYYRQAVEKRRKSYQKSR